jgi:hypothetical protein
MLYLHLHAITKGKTKDSSIVGMGMGHIYVIVRGGRTIQKLLPANHSPFPSIPVENLHFLFKYFTEIISKSVRQKTHR